MTPLMEPSLPRLKLSDASAAPSGRLMSTRSACFASDARQWRECVRHEVGGHGEGDSLRSRRSACGGGHGMTPLQLLSEALRHQRSGAAHGGAEAELGWLHPGRVDHEGGHRVARFLQP